VVVKAHDMTVVMIVMMMMRRRRGGNIMTKMSVNVSMCMLEEEIFIH